MKNKYPLLYFIFLAVNLNYSQVPLPPIPPKQNAKTKVLIYGDSSKKSKKEDEESATKIIEVSNNVSISEENTSQKSIQPYNVSITELTNQNSVYYYKNVQTLLQKLDTTAVTAAQIISLTKYKIHSNTINPTRLDSMARKAYKLNEDKKYDEAIITSKEILNLSPNNISGHKELAYAYKGLGNHELSNLYFEMMVKIITSIFQYGDGSRKSPYILNNFFEGISIYEAKFECYPKKVTVLLTPEKVLLGGYDCYHIMRFSNLTHWLPLLKEGDYEIE
ncbi:DUF4919 domain-containing protein [Flavobacterium ajazii]|uniref:DUF4919 domain-containing protein n=1 Tax=Flavobacterium ajazii TaxID=2692318 RepID=UPI0013D3798F|nr:DUF4919 domain-containing protein [Flavobacterium ajazii]